MAQSPASVRPRPFVSTAQSVAATATPALNPDKTTAWAKWLCVTIMAITLSAFRDWRIEVGGLLMHPHLILTALLFAIALVTEIGRFPDDFVRSLSGFFLAFVFSTIPEQGGSDQILKVGSAMVTIVIAAFCIRTDKDYRLAVVVLVTAIMPIAVRGITSAEFETVSGINPLEGISNKNGFSVFALPAILLGGHYFLDPSGNKIVRAWVGLCVLVTIFAIFSSGNRSGWVGVALCFLLFLGIPRRRLRGFTWVVLAGAIVTWIVINYGNTFVLEDRMEMTRNGSLSDETRRALFSNALLIGLENPVLGVSPQRLPFVLAHAVHFRMNVVDPHNVFGFIIGGSGLTTMFALAYVGWQLCSRVRQRPAAVYSDALVQNAMYIARCLVLVWCVRGMFSREILYNPCFCIAIGIVFSYRRIHEQRAHEEFLRSQPAPAAPAVPALPTPRRLVMR